jgi:hypothetical protein
MLDGVTRGGILCTFELTREVLRSFLHRQVHTDPFYRSIRWKLMPPAIEGRPS